MALTAGIAHISIVTPNIDRLSAFYRDVLDATIVQTHPTPFGGRICIVRVGDGVALNLFQLPAADEAPRAGARFQRGALDHFGITATNTEAFWALRDRLVALGCSTGEVTDFGPVLGVEFTDPDGMTVELDLVVDPLLAGGHPPVPYSPTLADTLS